MSAPQDLVTLSWCLGEIRQAFAQAEGLLEKQLAAEPDDFTSLRLARVHIHQAGGALLVIDVSGVVTLVREIEMSLDAVENKTASLSGDLVSRITAAARATVEYLEDLIQGEPHRPLYLFPYMKALLEARGAERIHPADLFDADLMRSLPPVTRDESAISDDQIEKAKQGFETGLLRYLREPGSPRGVEYMFSAVTTLERSRLAGPNRNFWRVVLAFFDALRTGALPPDVYSRRLLARVNLQLRQTIDKAAPIADRLFRDTLFSLAYAKGGSPIVSFVRKVYALDGIVPDDFETPRYGRHDVRVMRAAREALVKAKVCWDKVMRGSVSEMTGVSQAFDAFREAVDQLPGAGMKALALALVETRRTLAAHKDRLADAKHEPATLELATAILFAEQVLEQGGRAGDSYDPQAAEMARRLTAAVSGQADDLGDVPDWLRLFSRAAQERLTMTTFVAETLGNLRSVEKDLDTYFRDPTKLSELPEAIRSLNQVAGAMALLGHQDASSAAQVAAQRVSQFAEAASPPHVSEFERVASSLGALGFFVEGLLQPERHTSSFEFDETSGEFRARLADAGESRVIQATATAAAGLLAVTPSANQEAIAAVSDARVDTYQADSELFASDPVDLSNALTLDDDLAAQAIEVTETSYAGETVSFESSAKVNVERTESLLASLTLSPGDHVVRGQLKEALEQVRDDAMLHDDAALEHKATAAIDLLGSSTSAGLEELTERVSEFSPASQVEEIVAPVVPDSDSDVDSELLEIFLAEAAEVLDGIRASVELSRKVPSDLQYLTTIRRGFHTLKGSSRMVGLNSFGEAGWSMEQVMNAWLADEQPGTESLYALVETSSTYFDAWVKALAVDPHSRVFPAAVVAAAELFRTTGECSLEAYSQVGNAPLIDPAPVDEALQAAAVADVFNLETSADDDSDPLSAIVVAAPAAVPMTPVTGVLAEARPVDEIELRSLVPDQYPDLSVDLPDFGPQLDAAIAEMVELSPIGELQLPPADGAEPVSPEVVVFDPPHESLEAQNSQESGESQEVQVALEAIEPNEAHEAQDTNNTQELLDVPSASDDFGDYVSIDGRQLSRPLYMIFLGEADELVGRLVQDSREWQEHHKRLIEEPVIRAAHSLKGSSALVGLSQVHEIAKALESTYLRLNSVPTELSDAQVATITAAVDQIQIMLHQFAGGREPAADPQTLAALAELDASLQSRVPRPEYLGPETVGDVMDSNDLGPDAVYRGQSSDPALIAGDNEQDVERGGILSAPGAEFIGSLTAAGLGEPIEVDEVVDSAGATDPTDTIDVVDTVDLADTADTAEFGTTAAAAVESRADPDEPRIVDEIDADLLPIFIEEAADYLPQIGEDLRQWAEAPANLEPAHRLMRAMHTVKGSARMAGAMNLGQHVHEMETQIESLLILQEVPLEMIESLTADHDRTVALFEAVKDPSKAAAVPPRRRPGTLAPVVDVIDPAPLDEPAGVDRAALAPDTVELDTNPQIALAALPGSTAAEPDRVAFLAPAPLSQQVLTAAENTGSAAPATPARDPRAVTAAQAPVQLVRVRADLLDRLVNDAGEVSIARSRLDNELSGLRQSLVDLTENVNRLRTQLREIEIQAESQIQARYAQQREQDRSFDPLEFDRFTRFQELARMLAESVNDVATVQHNASRNLDTASQDLLRQGQVLRELQQNLMRVRMVQFGSISDRMYRVVRQAAKESDKRVNLDLRGSAAEIDRGVLEKMAGPIEHLLRNAVAHGIETREERLAAGKSETGEIRIEVRQEGNEIVLSFSDDGKGLDIERIKARAVKQGLVDPDVQLSAREAAELIFAPGFSTAEKVTELSGRGVGMDVVRAETNALGGRIDTESEAGKGTRFIVHLPLTLAVAQVVMVHAGEHRFAVPSSSVEHVMQLKPHALTQAYESKTVEWQGQPLPIVYLGTLIEAQDLQPLAQHYSPVVIVRSGSQRIAMHVDSISRNQEVVVKNVGPQVARVHGVSGATVMGNGDIVLIINPVMMAQTVGNVLDSGERIFKPLAAELSNLPATIMVVDDSVTVRKVTQRLLVRERYDVQLAKDGVDALRQLQDTIPDVMLVDIEMPRMDGFDLTRHVRADERLKHIPIIMITSRTADKHRNYAKSLGVNGYLGKPYVDDELLALIRSLPNLSKVAARALA